MCAVGGGDSTAVTTTSNNNTTHKKTHPLEELLALEFGVAHTGHTYTDRHRHRHTHADTPQTHTNQQRQEPPPRTQKPPAAKKLSTPILELRKDLAWLENMLAERAECLHERAARPVGLRDAALKHGHVLARSCALPYRGLSAAHVAAGP